MDWGAADVVLWLEAKGAWEGKWKSTGHGLGLRVDVEGALGGEEEGKNGR